MSKQILPIESIRERDIDLILLEELNVSPPFCSWLIQSIGLPQITSIEGAWRSVNGYGLGETDVLFSYYTHSEKIYILFENKLDASFQIEQFNRYATRAKKYCEDKDCDTAYSVLVAPTQYCENQCEFELCVTYESIANFFASSGENRYLFKSKLLDIAINKLRRGFQAVNSPTVQEFWMQYWCYSSLNYPMLKMKKPVIVPEGSDWPILQVDQLQEVKFYHKLHQGAITAVISNPNPDLLEDLKTMIDEAAEISHAGNRFSIKIETDKVDRKKDFASQSTRVDLALKNIQSLASLISDAEATC